MQSLRILISADLISKGIETEDVTTLDTSYKDISWDTYTSV